MKFLWGSLARLFSSPGVQHATDLALRKPMDPELDMQFGERLTPRHIDNIRKLAIRNGTPESRLQDGFEKDLFVATISDESRDRYGDRILVDGWQLDDFRKNPVLLFGHDYESPAVGHGIDIFKDTVKTQRGKGSAERRRLRGLFLWSRANPLAAVLKGLYADGDMRAFSVGFIPEEFLVPKDDDERKDLDLGDMGVLHKEQVLLENSAVPVPANPNAISEESFQAYRKSLSEAEFKGLAKLVERLKDVDAELTRSVRAFLPSNVQVTVPDTPPPAVDLFAASFQAFGVDDVEQATDETVNRLAARLSMKPETTEQSLQRMALRDEFRRRGLSVPTGLNPSQVDVDAISRHAMAEKGDSAYWKIAAAVEHTKGPAEAVDAILSAWRVGMKSILTTEGDLEKDDQGVSLTPGSSVDLLNDIMTDGTTSDATSTAAMDGCPMGEDCPMDEKSKGSCPMGKDCPMDKALTIETPVEGVVPGSVTSERAEPATAWEPLTAEDFDFDNLSDEERSVAVGFFAYAERVPPESFAQLHLGHHRREDGAAVLQAVQDCIAQLNTGEASIPPEARRAAYEHLAEHLEDFGVEVPEFVESPEKAPNSEGGSDNKATAPQMALTPALSALQRAGSPNTHHWRVVRSHKPRTAPEETTLTRDEFDRAVGDNFDLRRECSLIYDDQDRKNPRAYLGLHHLADEGTPVVWKNVQREMKRLLSGALSDSISDAVRRRAYYHLRTHYDQFGREAPAFRSLEQVARLAAFLRSAIDGLCDGTPDVREQAETMLDFVYGYYSQVDDRVFETHALSFPQASWEEDAARTWARENGFSVESTAHTDEAYVYVQREASHFVGAFQSQRLDNGTDGTVNQIVGKAKSQASLLSERVSKIETALQEGFARIEQRQSPSIKALRDFMKTDNGKAEGNDPYAEILKATESMKTVAAQAAQGLAALAKETK